MHFTEGSSARRLVLASLFALTACSAPRAPAPTPAPQATPAPGARPAPAPAPSVAAPRARNWDEYRLQVARRLVAANSGATYLDKPPDQLLAIPVLEVELHRDGSIRAINIQRRPSQATDTIQLAIDAVRRAGPFGDVSHLPQPWRFSEVFLFRDDRKFKPRTLDN